MKVKKRYLFVALILIIAMSTLGMAGCSGNSGSEEPSSDTEAEAPAPEPVAEEEPAPADSAPDAGNPYPGAEGKTATIILKDLTNPVWIQAGEGAKEAAAQFGMDIEVAAPTVSNNNDEQIQLVQQAIAKKKDIVILTPADSTGIVPAVTELNSADIPVINLNTKINNDSGKANSETFVVADNIQCATLCAEELAKLAEQKGEVLILQGPSGGQVTIDLTKGAEDVFKKYPDMKVVDHQDANFDRATGYSVTQNMLQTYPDLKVIFSCNDEMALGALKAVEEAEKQDQIFIGGIDGNQDALKAIDEGRLDVTVFKNFWLQAYTAVEAAAKYLDGQSLEPLIPVELTVVTKDNAKEFIES
jgi:ABC-type sugar transport system substrate-binding protein